MAKYRDCIEETEVGNVRIVIRTDDDAMDPREWDNIGRMVCYHRRYGLGDDKKKLGFSFNPDNFEGWEEIEKWLEEEQDAAVIFPVSLHDHSSIFITMGVARGWDSGQVGFIYITNEDMRKEWPDLDKSQWYEKAYEVLMAEVYTYNRYLMNGFYYFTIESLRGEHLESCGGFESVSDALEEGKVYAEHWNKQEGERIEKVRAEISRVEESIKGLDAMVVSIINHALGLWRNHEGA